VTSARPTLAASDAVFAWCLRNAQRMERAGDAERAALWAYIAAGTGIYYGHSRLCSPPLEALVARLGNAFAGPAMTTRAESSRRRWLHVLSESATIGGHTALVRRWIALDRSNDAHDVALTMQPTESADPALVRATNTRGGNVASLAGEPALLARALRLRQLANESADVVVLHAHQWDVVPSLAFAAAGGPPVLLLNHADHAFWIGAGVADTVIDIRDSGLALSKRFRGIQRSALLPVPLEDNGAAPGDRSSAARRLGDASLLDAGLVLLSIGSGYKYREVPGLDFPQTLARIVEALPEARVVAVGPEPGDALWQSLASRTSGRVRAVGPDAELRPWHEAADLYLEGFPVGSYTAMLEVGLAGRAIVRKPLLAPVDELPVDRGALAAVEPPVSPDAYVDRALAYARNPGTRSRDAEATRSAIVTMHTGPGWNQHLERLRASLPSTHAPRVPPDVPMLSRGLVDYWASFHATPRAETALQFAMRTAEAQGLQVRTDIALREALDAAK
jgi:hypothetical protein